jgi:hypothetical protein
MATTGITDPSSFNMQLMTTCNRCTSALRATNHQGVISQSGCGSRGGSMSAGSASITTGIVPRCSAITGISTCLMDQLGGLLIDPSVTGAAGRPAAWMPSSYQLLNGINSMLQGCTRAAHQVCLSSGCKAAVRFPGNSRHSQGKDAGSSIAIQRQGAGCRMQTSPHAAGSLVQP